MPFTKKHEQNREQKHEQHEQLKQKKRIYCLLCNKTYASKSSLSNHKKVCKNRIVSDTDMSKEPLMTTLKELDLLDKIRYLTEKVYTSTDNESSNDTDSIDSQSSRLFMKNMNSTTTTKQPHNNPSSRLFTKNMNSTTTMMQPKCNPGSRLFTNQHESNKKVFTCTYCNRYDFSYQQSLSRHIKTCSKKVELERKTEELQKKVDDLLKEKEEWKKDKDKLNKDKDKFADLATTNNNLIKTSISAMKYFMTNFKDAPALKSIEDLSTIKTDYNNTNFIKQLISMYRNENLAAYIGEYIVNIYKTNDSSKQTMWSSDVDRLTYIISEAVAKDKTTWVTDKKGITVGERVIRPALEYIKPLLQKFIMECGAEVMTDDTISSRRQAELIECQKLATHIVVLIDNKVLEKDIIKYIAPLLYWNKNTLLDIDTSDITVKVIEHVKKSKNKPIKRNNNFKSSKPVKNIKIINKPITEKTFVKQKNKKSSPKTKPKTKVIEYSSTDLDEDSVDDDSYDSDEDLVDDDSEDDLGRSLKIDI
jgi:hypothetical protein